MNRIKREKTGLKLLDPRIAKYVFSAFFFEKEKLQGTVRSPNKGNGRGGVVTSTSLNPANDMALTGSNLVQKGEEEERCLQQTTEC